MKVKLADGLKLRSYQLQDAGLCWRNPRFANLSEMGAGKTLPTAVVIAGLVKSKRVQKAIVIMPPILLYDWKECLERQLDMGINVYVYHGTDRSQASAVAADVILTTYTIFVNETLKPKPKTWPKRKKWPRRLDTNGFFYRFLRAFPTAMVLDEASAIRRPDSKRSFAAVEVADLTRRYYLLSGNPAPNGAEDFYPMMRILVPEAYFSLQHFMHEHCIMSKGPFPSVVSYKNLEKLSEHLGKVSVRHLKAEVMSELPEKTYVIRELDMSAEHRALYQSMLSDKFLVLPDDRVLDMQNAFSIIIRSRQIGSNPATLGFPEESPKWSMLEQDLEWIGREGHKVVIFVEWVVTANMVKKAAERAGWNVAMMADTANFDAPSEKIRFQKGDANLLVVNPASGGLGVNLSMANYNIFFEYSYNLEHHDQALERSHRTGLVGPLTVIYYVTKDTIEESMLEVLQRKKTMSADILRDPVRLRSFVKYSERVVSKLDPQMGIQF